MLHRASAYRVFSSLRAAWPPLRTLHERPSWPAADRTDQRPNGSSLPRGGSTEARGAGVTTRRAVYFSTLRQLTARADLAGGAQGDVQLPAEIQWLEADLHAVDIVPCRGITLRALAGSADLIPIDVVDVHPRMACLA